MRLKIERPSQKKSENNDDDSSEERNEPVENLINHNQNPWHNIFSNIRLSEIMSGSTKHDVKTVLEDIDKIPLLFIDDKKKIEGNDKCIMCYDEFVYSDLIRKLPCGHNSHHICIDQYLTTESNLCPLCQNQVGEGKYLGLD